MRGVLNGICHRNLRKCWRNEMATISDINTCSFDIIVLTWRDTLNTLIKYSLNKNYLISIWMRKLPTNFRCDQAVLDCNHTRLHPVSANKESTVQVSDISSGIVPLGLPFRADLSNEVVILCIHFGMSRGRWQHFRKTKLPCNHSLRFPFCINMFCFLKWTWPSNELAHKQRVPGGR